jgi:crotonobetainyl-CoA:carnitine CoA-transferase CaiB-like acyl-CoA transferase
VQLEDTSPPVSLPPASAGSKRILSGIKVLEICRIIAGPTIARILGEYGADVLKVVGPGLSDVPFFQVDGNMGKRTAEIDLKSSKGRKIFESLLEDVDIIIDGYRPGALEKLGYSADAMARIAQSRGKGIVYVNENCFGYVGEWADRPGWQQIADCVSLCYNYTLDIGFVANNQNRSAVWLGLKVNLLDSMNHLSPHFQSQTTAPGK